MKCPIDNVDLVMSERQGIEIDYCPTCRGVWLDRGELDKIIERSANDAMADRVQNYQAEPQRQERPREYDDRYDRGRNYGHKDSHHYKHKKKESFLGEIFDF
jgi:Zn-finger nucleic acid-binding protein